MACLLARCLAVSAPHLKVFVFIFSFYIYFCFDICGVHAALYNDKVTTKTI